jgi:hypothetical protein
MIWDRSLPIGTDTVAVRSGVQSFIGRPLDVDTAVLARQVHVHRRRRDRPQGTTLRQRSANHSAVIHVKQVKTLDNRSPLACVPSVPSVRDRCAPARGTCPIHPSARSCERWHGDDSLSVARARQRPRIHASPPSGQQYQDRYRRGTWSHRFVPLLMRCAGVRPCRLRASTCAGDQYPRFRSNTYSRYTA